MTQERVVEEREVGFLVDPEAHFVSLVDRGANQIPFRIVKVQKEAQAVKRVVHKIVAPKEVSPEEIALMFEEGVLKWDKATDAGPLRMYEQVATDAFEEGSFELAVLDAEKGIRCITGTLKEQKPEGVIAKFLKRKRVEEEKEVPAIAEQAQTMTREDAAKEMAPVVEEELWQLVTAIAGILGTRVDGPKKIKMVQSVFDAFRDFLESTLFLAGEEAVEVKVEKREKEAIEEREEKDDGLRRKEETVAEESEGIKVEGEEARTKAEDGEEERQEAVKEEEEKEKEVSEIEVLRSELKKLEAEVASVVERLAGMEKLKEAVEEMAEAVQKAAKPAMYRQSDEAPQRESQRKAIFKGILNL